MTRGTRGKTHPQSAFKVAHLAAGGCFFELNSYKNLNKQVLKNSVLKVDVICPEARGVKRIRSLLSRWHTLPPEASLEPLIFVSLKTLAAI